MKTPDQELDDAITFYNQAASAYNRKRNYGTAQRYTEAEQWLDRAAEAAGGLRLLTFYPDPAQQADRRPVRLARRVEQEC